MSTEYIKFEISFKTNWWKDPPNVAIYLDDQEKFVGNIDKNIVIAFSQTLEFKKHTLSIRRTGKDNQQVRLDDQGNYHGQELFIEWIKIDGVNIRNLIWTNSYYEPIYPQPWAAQQSEQGINLEKHVLGETCLSHNGTWRLDFNSPFYKFLMDWMG